MYPFHSVRHYKLPTEKEIMAFITKLNKFFETAIKLHKLGRPFQWESLIKFVRRCKTDLSNIYKLHCFCPYLINLLYEIPCHDKSIATRILYFYTNWLRDMQYEHYLSSRNFEKNSNRVTLSEVLTKKKVNYLYDNEDCSLLEDSLISAILSGDLKFMKILVRYGVTLHLSHNRFAHDVEKLLAIKCNRVGPFSTYLRHDYHISCCISNMKDRIFKPLYDLPLERGITQAHMIPIFLNAVHSRSAHQDTNYNECLKLLFQTVTTPIYSMQEMRLFVNYAFDEIYTKDFTEVICQELRTLFPEITEMYQPRSLMHLSRCQVRSCLVNAPRVLEDVISDLMIPVHIKRYILIS